jgi:uncharacterized protein (DUF697 family)
MDASNDGHDSVDRRNGVAQGRHAQALRVVSVYSAASATVGLIPVPFIDMAAISGIQLRMLYRLSGLYDLPFSLTMVKSLVGSLLGGVLPVNAAWGTAGSLVKAVPGVGTYLGWATMPALAAATTYGIGRVFVEHFESDGTFLTFEPERARACMRAHMARPNSGRSSG